MILHFNYEELTALKAGAQFCLDGEGADGGVVIAPAETRACVEALVPRLVGYLSLSTLAEVKEVQTAVEAIVECLRIEMESMVASTHAADECAVSAYFDFAHGFSVAHRVREMANEMEAVIELVTGDEPTQESERTFQFPD